MRRYTLCEGGCGKQGCFHVIQNEITRRFLEGILGRNIWICDDSWRVSRTMSHVKSDVSENEVLKRPSYHVAPLKRDDDSSWYGVIVYRTIYF
jgi:hypothetical protein